MFRVGRGCWDEVGVEAVRRRGGRRRQEVAAAVPGDQLGVGGAGVGSGHRVALLGGGRRGQVLVVLLIDGLVVVGHGVDVLVRGQTGGRLEGAAAQVERGAGNRPVVMVVQADGADRRPNQVRRLHRARVGRVRTTLGRDVTTLVFLQDTNNDFIHFWIK